MAKKSRCGASAEAGDLSLGDPAAPRKAQLNQENILVSSSGVGDVKLLPAPTGPEQPQSAFELAPCPRTLFLSCLEPRRSLGQTEGALDPSYADGSGRPAGTETHPPPPRCWEHPTALGETAAAPVAAQRRRRGARGCATAPQKCQGWERPSSR